MYVRRCVCAIHTHRLRLLAASLMHQLVRFVELYFGSVDKSMVSLFQIMTLESWSNGIARPANALVPGLMSLFVAFVLFYVCSCLF